MDIDLQVKPHVKKALRELATRKLEKQFRQAQAEQDAMPKQLREANSVDGMGAVEMRVHATAYHEIAHREGTYDCWKDDGFRRDFRKRAPETAVKSGKTRIHVGFSPAYQHNFDAIFRKEAR